MFNFKFLVSGVKTEKGQIRNWKKLAKALFEKTENCGSQIDVCLKLAHYKSEKENPFHHGRCIICRLPVLFPN